MPIEKNFLSGGRELSQISMAKDVRGLSTWVASLFKKTIDAVNQTNQAAVATNQVTGASAQVVATPATSPGTAAPTKLTTAYLTNAPATADAIGAVKPDGTTITVAAGGVLSAASAAPPSGPGNEVYATPANGSSGDAEIRSLVAADLPAATGSEQGAVVLDGDLGGTAASPEVVATHLVSPLPVSQGGTGTTTPSLVAGANVTITGTWPNQTVAASGGGGSGNLISGAGTPSGVVLIQAATVLGDSIAFTHPVTAGNYLVVTLNTGSSPSGLTVTDTVGTTYSLLLSDTSGLGPGPAFVMYGGLAGGSGTNTVTIGSHSPSYDNLGCMEVAGVSGVDVSNSLNTGSGGTSPASISVTTTVVNDFLVFAVAGNHSANVFAFSGGFLVDSQINGSDAQAIGHQFGAAASSYTATTTITGAGADYAILFLIAFKPTSSSTPGSDGDFYIDTVGKGIWGPRASGGYPLIGTLN